MIVLWHLLVALKLKIQLCKQKFTTCHPKILNGSLFTDFFLEFALWSSAFWKLEHTLVHHSLGVESDMWLPLQF